MRTASDLPSKKAAVSAAVHVDANQKSRVRQNIESFVLAVLVALTVRSSVVEAFWVPSGSMLPTIQIGDHLFVNKLAYNLKVPFLGYEVVRWGHVQRGDIVVFVSPQKERIDLIKRIVAVSGDTVEIRNKVLYVNGDKVDDTHARFLDTRHQSVVPRDNYGVDSDGDGRIDGPITVPPGKMFCLGDNRDHSHDSRYWGFADERDVKGKATFIYWSRASGEMPRWERFGRILR
jgi:signal peptidase I